MSSFGLIRWCGLTAMVGGIVFASLGLLGLLYTYLYSPTSQEDIPLVLNYIPIIFELLLLAGAMAAIVGLHTAQRGRYGLLGALASLTAFVGVAMLFAGGLVDVVAGQRYPVVAWILTVGVVVATVGLLALGSITIVARVLPWWCGALTILGSPFFAIFLFSGFLPEGLVGVAWAVVGYALLQEAEARQAQHNPRA